MEETTVRVSNNIFQGKCKIMAQFVETKLQSQNCSLKCKEDHGS